MNKAVEKLAEHSAEELFVRRLMRTNGLNGQQARTWWDEAKLFKDDILIAREDAKQILSENNLYLEIEEDTSYVDGAGFERKRTTKRLIPLAEELKK